MRTRNTVAVTALLLVGLLATGCSQDTPTPSPTPTQSSTTPATPTPEATTPSVPEAEEYDGTVVVQDENGVITLPNGEVADCPPGTKGALISKEGVVSCDTGADW